MALQQNWRLYHLLCAICPAVGLLQLLHSECHAQFSVQNCHWRLWTSRFAKLVGSENYMLLEQSYVKGQKVEGTILWL